MIGEYSNSIESEINERKRGVYRLRVAYEHDPSYLYEETVCIPYHTTAPEMEGYLNSLSLISERGGVSVRRSGDGKQLFSFGYSYRIELDAPLQKFYLANNGSVSISVGCVGRRNCDCADTKVSLIDETGQDMCLLSGNSSRADSRGCAIPPDITTTRLTALSFAHTSGEGRVLVAGGTHRLPANSPLTIGAIGGRGIITSNNITWFGLVAEGEGELLFAGQGWDGWDSAVLVFEPANTKGRGDPSLNTAPTFTMYCEEFRLRDIGTVLAAGPGSIFYWHNGTWNGGVIGGLSTLYILERLSAAGTAKSLRYGCTLHIIESAAFQWASGNLSLSNGAAIRVDGTMEVLTFGYQQFFGESGLLEMPADAPYQELLDIEPELNSIDYYDDFLPEYLRVGYYSNPLCGDKCTVFPSITVSNDGRVIAESGINATFAVPLNLEDRSRLQLGVAGFLNLQSGGGCGNEVFLEIEELASVSLTGGSFFMGATCTITGNGELTSVAGTHDLSFSINAHITISGGTMRWPKSRGDASTLRFYGGLLIEHFGSLVVEPWETTIIVDNTVHFKDECLLQFPMIGTAAQPSVYDSLNAPDISPRGNLTATDIMQWDGGTLRGKADFVSNKVLYLSGGIKRIRSLAKLVNKGHAEWASGDILMADQADFVNLGTVQMANGTRLFDANNLVEGTVLPVENGGDVFALDFHSWDLDQGALDYTGKSSSFSTFAFLTAVQSMLPCELSLFLVHR